MGLFCGIVKTGLVIAVIGGGIAFVAVEVLGHDRIQDLVTSVRGDLNESVDEMIDDRRVLEARVEDVRETYPKEIANLRKQLREAELAHTETEQGMLACETVLEIVQEDIGALSFAIKDANLDADGVIRFQDRLFAPAEAHTMVAKSENVSEEYRARHNRLADEKDLLEEQIRLLNEEITTLKTEWDSFEAEYRTIQRQLDQIERNDKIIELSKARNYSRDSAKRKKLTSLKQIQDKIESVRMQQEEELRVLRRTGPEAGLEARAKARMAATSQGK